MEIYYLNKNSFLKSTNIESLMSFSDGRKYNSEEKLYEHLCGIFLTKFIAKNVYDLDNTEIELDGKKPYFKTRKIYFSISHSKNLVLVAFCKSDIGVDIEFMQDRDFERVLSRYSSNTKTENKEDFYKFWTKHEAKIKLGAEQKSEFYTILNDEYALTCVCKDELITNLSIKEMFFDGENIDLTEEYITPSKIHIKKTLH